VWAGIVLTVSFLLGVLLAVVVDRWADVMLRSRNGAAESRETVPVTEPILT
jgi:hypothetical protein